jgi:hypothetical protein
MNVLGINKDRISKKDFTNGHGFIFQFHLCFVMFLETWNGGPHYGTNESKICTLHISNVLYI